MVRDDGWSNVGRCMVGVMLGDDWHTLPQCCFLVRTLLDGGWCSVGFCKTSYFVMKK